MRNNDNTEKVNRDVVFELPISQELVHFCVTNNNFFQGYIAENEYVGIIKFIDMYAIISVPNDRVKEFLDYVYFNVVDMFPLVCSIVDEVSEARENMDELCNDVPLSKFNLTGKGVLLGIIDTGIDYTKETFRNSDGSTRIAYIWDQTISENSSNGVVFGKEYNKYIINEALQLENPLDLVPHEDNSGHGTFLASIAGGSETRKHVGVASEAEFVIVKLKRASSYYLNHYAIPRKKRRNAFLSSDIMLAIDYVISKATELGKPVSICLALGTTFGVHNGHSALEEYINAITNRPGLCITIAGGNERLTRHHTSGKILKDSAKEIEIEVQEEMEGFYTTIVMGPMDRYSVSVMLPNGELIGPVPARPGTNLEVITKEKTSVLLTYHFPTYGSGGQLTTIRFLNPPMGISKITLYADVVFDGTYHAWLPISTLSSPGLSFVNAIEEQTIVVPGTLPKCITCGSYQECTDKIYERSSQGPTVQSRIKPDLVAPGVRMKGMYPSGYGTMSGTGVATAYTAGTCALMFEWGQQQQYENIMNTDLIKSYLIKGCDRTEGITYPNNVWGYGKINIDGIFESFKRNSSDIKKG